MCSNGDCFDFPSISSSKVCLCFAVAFRVSLATVLMAESTAMRVATVAMAAMVVTKTMVAMQPMLLSCKWWIGKGRAKRKIAT